MKFALPAALLVAVALSYVALAGPPPPPTGPVPWHNPDKTPPAPPPGLQAMGGDVGARQVGARVVFGPFQLQPHWTDNPLYVEWYKMVEDPSYPISHPLRTRAVKWNDPF